MKARPCPCGSGLDSYWNNDARGIPLCRTCRKCHKAKMATYRREVLVNSSYQCDEPVEED